MASSRPGADPCGPFAGLAEHLVALRRAARMSQRHLAAAAAVSRGTVQRAESGTAAPSTAVLDALVRACGGDQAGRERAYVLRNQGRSDHRDRLRGLEAPAPALIRTAQDLGAALAAEYERAGAPCPSDLVRPAGDRRRIPRTTAWRITNRRGLPADAEQLQTFLDVCRVRPSAQQHYHEAFQHIHADRSKHPAPPHPDPARHRARPGNRQDHPLVQKSDGLHVPRGHRDRPHRRRRLPHRRRGAPQRHRTAPPRSVDNVMRTARELFVESSRLPGALRGPDVTALANRGDLVLVEAKSSSPPQRGTAPAKPLTFAS
ncbi:helix-turn-helix transcriptional regulator [Streptomyces sp. NPDC047085]|uniref:helix-turn-helix domain-containing protein n=1 Tax=Streptomyces sp. NPDC047085 TaxID=3155140 RepID=UPI0033D9E59A